MTAPPTRRPDASMTLIREIMDQPLDPGYAAESARRLAAGKPSSSGLRSPVVLLACIVVGLILGVAAESYNRDVPSIARTKAGLIDQIGAARVSADRTSSTVARLQSEVSAMESRQLPDLTPRLLMLEEGAGTTPVRGPAYVVSLDDAPSADAASSQTDPRVAPASGGRVLSRDLQIVVNGLWSAGAEAIAINGQRLTASSAIRFAGDAILVNFRPLTRPYVITSLGDPAAIAQRLAASAGGSYLADLKNNFGIIVDTQQLDGVTIPGATSLTVRYAVPDVSTPVTQTPSEARS